MKTEWSDDSLALAELLGGAPGESPWSVVMATRKRLRDLSAEVERLDAVRESLLAKLDETRTP